MAATARLPLLHAARACRRDRRRDAERYDSCADVRLFQRSGESQRSRGGRVVAHFERRAGRTVIPEGAADRLTTEGPSPREDYLAAYNRVDISLSPFPYPGGTTTAESLWMGVPVLCRHGDRFLGHLCESVLHSVNLGEWIAAGDDDYVAKAVAFAGERQALAALRADLRARVLASSLCNPDRFARTLEQQFDAMWHAYRSGAKRP